MDRERIREIIRIAQESPIAELHVREGDLEVRVVKASSEASVQATEDASVNGESSPQPSSQETIVIRATKVGFFHRGRGPGDPPLVSEGDLVKVGQPIGTLEALRKLTDVTAEVTGTVVRVLCEDGRAVEYGQPLFEIQPAEGAGEDESG